MMIETNDASNPKRLGNALIGERIHTLMWRQGRTQKTKTAPSREGQGRVSECGGCRRCLVVLSHEVDAPTTPREQQP